MEGKKKSGKALLEEKQMKRYFRSIKRSKGKIKKESPKRNSDIEASTEKTGIEQENHEITKDQVPKKNVQKPTTPVADLHPPNSTKIGKTNVTEEINQDKRSEKMVQTTTGQKREQAQQTPDVNNPSDDLDDNLDDWEIVQYPEENKRENEDGNMSDCVNNKGDIDDGLSPTTDQNKAWVQEMNKINENAPPNTSEGLESQIEQLKNNQIQEFSPIVYWKDPLPDIEPLEEKSVEEENTIYIENLIPDIEQENGKIQTVFLEDLIPLLKGKAKNKGTLVSKNSDHKSDDKKKYKEINTDMIQTVWLDKSRYEDAEMKYHKNLATHQDAQANFIQSNNLKTFNEKKKKSRKNVEPTKIEPYLGEKCETKSSLEKKVKNLEDKNSEFKISLVQLNELVKRLEERVTNLEDRSQSCSLTDEGVDMTEESKCTFFNDCICNYEVAEESGQILDNMSLNDGSEFEEFIATTALDNSDAPKDNLWQEDWDDISGCDLATELRKNCRKTNA